VRYFPENKKITLTGAPYIEVNIRLKIGKTTNIVKKM
jgi:hypothetical protein